MDIWGEIGESAGKIFTALEKSKKDPTVAAVKKAAGLTDELALMGVGWLAREDKVVAYRKGKSVYLKLK